MLQHPPSSRPSRFVSDHSPSVNCSNNNINTDLASQQHSQMKLIKKRLSSSNLALPTMTNLLTDNLTDNMIQSPINTDTVITAISSSSPLPPSTKDKLKVVKPTAKIMQSRIYFHQNAELLFLNFEDFYLETKEDVDLVIKFIELTFLNYITDEELQRGNSSPTMSIPRRNSFGKSSNPKKNVDVYVNYDRFYCHESLLKYYTEKISYLEMNYYRSVKRFTTESIEDKHLMKLERTLRELKEEEGVVRDAVIKNFEILGDRYIISENLIARGTFGRVFLGSNKDTGEFVAIKELKRKNIDNVERLKEFIDREMSICKLLSDSLKNGDEHIGKKYICKFYDVIYTETNYYIVMEYMANGSLENPLEEREMFPSTVVKKFFKQIAHAIHYIHNTLGICHRDIQLANLCLGQDQDIRLIDFGLSDFFMPNIKKHSSFCGNKDYASPEMILSDRYVGNEVDCYALGVLLYKMLVGYYPFRNTIDKILGQFYIPLDELEREGVLNSQSISLIKGLLEKDVTKRFTASDILNHEWLQDSRV
ncbi:hypothetical protein C9374_000191 [Naegleria lovaniensis]|uniref:Protein kinase domain-containing protein n=1 Tax=Naegleria lovaniensis TaxID=51637 RepID=A0AA88KTP3_NAELO|nr:uncharacterized protein C9374_000191 [Naegleria lovaniensis]KAG2388752.1 hypothetical protein C9374_000191 [Naegleria lovaniensis]